MRTLEAPSVAPRPPASRLGRSDDWWDRVAARLLSRRILASCPRPTLGDCWLWDGCRNSDGYGKLKLFYRRRRGGSVQWVDYVHRVSLATFGAFNLNSPRDVCHACDTPACFNPAHLAAASRLANVRECHARGRWRRCKLSDVEVIRARRFARKGKSLNFWALKNDVSYAAVRAAVAGQTYAHVTAEPPVELARRARPFCRAPVDVAAVEARQQEIPF